MKTTNVLHEDLLLEQYAQPAFLPPLWRVIFQEAMRGHHLLFSKSIVQAFDDNSDLLNPAVPNESLEEFCVHLFAAPDLKTIRSMINFLPVIEQRQLFAIYLNMMKSLRLEHKEQMN